MALRMWTVTVCNFLVIAYILSLTSASMETALTFQVPARKEQCFYEDVKENHEIEMDFQVLRVELKFRTILNVLSSELPL